MNRRELLKAALGTAFASGITEVQTLEMDESAVALVLKCPDRLDSFQRGHICNAFEYTFKGTPLEKVPVIILSGGMSLEAVKLPRGKK